MDPASSWTRLLVALIVPAFVAASFPVFWNLPATDADGEGLGHVVGHIAWGTVGLLVAAWFFRHRTHRRVGDAFRHNFGASLALASLFVVAAAQILLESPGAAVVWATGNETFHDLSIVTVTFAAEIGLVFGLLVWAVTTLVRRSRRRAPVRHPQA